MTIDPSSTSPEARVEAVSKKEVQARQGQGATAEYRAEQKATRDKTARLRAQRLAQDTEQPGTQPPSKNAAKPSGSRRARRGLHQGSRGKS